MRQPVPLWIWHVVHAISVAAAVALVICLVVAPRTGLIAWWLFVLLRSRAHCRPCVGCQKNRYDFNPHITALADANDPDPWRVVGARCGGGLGTSQPRDPYVF